MAYLVVGRVSVFDAVHYLTGGHRAGRPDWTVQINHHLRARPVTEVTASAAFGDEQTLPPFDDVVLGNGANATIAIGATDSVAVDGKDADRVTTNIQGGRLVVGSAGSDSRVRITLPHLRKLQLDGICNTEISGLKDPISIVVTGPGNVKASGDVDSLELVVAGAGNFELSSLHAKDAKIVLTGPGKAAVFATRNLNATVVDPGSVRYLGDPYVTQNVFGPGSVGRFGQG